MDVDHAAHCMQLTMFTQLIMTTYSFNNIIHTSLVIGVIPKFRFFKSKSRVSARRRSGGEGLLKKIKIYTHFSYRYS